jgi:hypothetical protein
MVMPESNNQHWKLIPIYLDKDFSKADRVVMDQVISEWNYVLNGYLKLQIVNDKLDHDDMESAVALVKKLRQTSEGVLVFSVDHDHGLVADDIEEEGGELAYVNALGDNGHFMFVIRDRIGTRNLHKILLHEFGHLMGANHVMAASLMFPAYSSSQRDCVDKITALQVAEYRKLDINHMNYCATPALP